MRAGHWIISGLTLPSDAVSLVGLLFKTPQARALFKPDLSRSVQNILHEEALQVPSERGAMSNETMDCQ